MLKFSENILKMFVLAKNFSGEKFNTSRECMRNKSDQYWNVTKLHLRIILLFSKIQEKILTAYQARSQEFFGAREISWNWDRHFDKCFIYDIQKKGPAGKLFAIFLPDTLKIAF